MPTTTITRDKRANLQLLPARRRSSSPSERTGAPEASILTLNISVAAEPRAARILRWLRRRNDQVIVLTETNGNAGTELIRRGLEDSGYSTHSAPEPGERGVLIASRLPVAEELNHAAITVPTRAQSISFSQPFQFVLLGIYVPSRDRSPEKVARKEQFLASVLTSIERLSPRQRSNLILLGDYNAVARHHVPPLQGFFPYEYNFHDELARLGLLPAHELKPWGKAQPHSWIGRTGIGYLYDYAHVGPGVRQRLRTCRYLHSPRGQRLSDHAAVALRLTTD